VHTQKTVSIECTFRRIQMTQLTGGMYGALLVLEPGQTYDPETDKVFVLGRSGSE